jgi:hypothetical protein
MQSVDFIYIYGKKKDGFINLSEFNQLLSDNVYSPMILDNIDDCTPDEEYEVKGIQNDLMS